MPGGRPRKSAASKLAEGDRRKIGRRKLADQAAAEASLATPGRPQLPTGLKLGKVGKAFWSEVLDELDRQGRLAKIDKFSLAAAAAAYEVYAGAYDSVRSRGRSIEIKSKQGTKVIANPDVITMQKMAGVVKQFLVEHGLTEASRTRLQKTDARAEDSLESLLNAGASPAQATVQ